MPPAWLHRKLSREDCEELIKQAGLDDGRFLVRSREGKPGEYVLCVVYKGKCTHHLIAKNDDGFYAINKKTFGDYTKVNRLIDALGKPKIPGWPVPLDKPVNVAEAPGSGAATTGPTKTSNASSTGWKAYGCSRDEVQESLKSADGTYVDGAFAVRDRPNQPDEYVLSVNFKGKPTHHLVSKNEDGNFVVNKKTYGGHTTIENLVNALSVKQAGWPVLLSTPSAPATAAEAAATPVPAPAAVPDPVPEPVPEPVAAPVSVPEPEPVVAVAEPVSVPEPEPVAPPVAEPEPEAPPEVPPRTVVSEPVVPQMSVEEEVEYVNRTKAAASEAKQDVYQKMAELHDLQSSSTTVPTLTLMNTPALSSTPTDGPELTFMLARAVLNLGQRVNNAEQKLSDLHTLLRSLNVLGN